MKFKVDNQEIDVIINRKKIKNLYIRIKDGKIVVNTNTFTSDKYVEKLLEREKENIKKMFEKIEIKNSNTCFYLGNELTYQYNEKIIIDENICYGPSIDVINEYLEKNCINIFEKRLERLKNMFNKLPNFILKVRKMKTRWGVCNKKNMTITLNTELIHKDVSLIDYVIIHELCHFKYMDHSPKFWDEVAKYYPYYKQARKMLKN